MSSQVTFNWAIQVAYILGLGGGPFLLLPGCRVHVSVAGSFFSSTASAVQNLYRKISFVMFSE
jgi:hypothetical protein